MELGGEAAPKSLVTSLRSERHDSSLDQPLSTPESRYAYVVDDDDVFRRSLVVLLESAGWRIQSYPNVAEFLNHCGSLPPGILLLDIRMPGVGGLDFLEHSQDQLVNFAVMVVSGHGDVDSVVRSLKAGAVEFIEKPFGGVEILTILDRAYQQLLAELDQTRRKSEVRRRIAALSAREVQVLTGLIAGAQYKTIAFHLGISGRTVEMYRNNMIRKLGARTTAEAVHMGMVGGLEPTDFQ